MPEVSVWLKTIPAAWWASVDQFRDIPDLSHRMEKIGAPPLQRTKLNSPDFPANFDCYLLRVYNHLRRMFKMVEDRCKGTGISSISVRSDTPNRGNVKDIDLLCYVLKSRTFSPSRTLAIALRNSGRTSDAEVLEKTLKDDRAGGVTYPFIQGNAVRGICSEVWCDTKDIGGDARGTANAIMHELMHNKSNWEKDNLLPSNAAPTAIDSNWPHLSGGGGLADANCNHPIVDLTPEGAIALAKRMAFRNRQYVDLLVD